MKYKKIMLASTFLLSVALLTGCVASDKETTVKEETPITQEKVTDNEPVEASKVKSDKKEEFKIVGNETNGFVKVPESFVEFKDIDSPDSPATQFSNKDQSIVVTYLAIDKELSFEDSVQSLKESMGMGGPEIQEKAAIYANLEGIELFQDFSTLGEDGYSDFRFFVYVLKGETADRYIAIEYYGDELDLKNEILESYSENKPTE